MPKLLGKYFIATLLFLGVASFAHASFEITEIMYDVDGTDTNREWLEVLNTGESADFSKWYLFSDNTKHALVPQGSSTVPSGGYAVIVQDATKFKQDWPNYAGLIFDSSWTGFDNDGETISLKDPDLNIAGSVAFSSSLGGAGDGNSLQKVGSAWAGASPTPGQANQASTSQSNSSSSPSSGSSSSAISTTTSIKETKLPQITTDIVSKNIVFAGQPFILNAHTLGYNKELLFTGKFVWNMGDGVSKEFKDQKEFYYEYDYAGEYVVNLSYFSSYYMNDIPDATDRMIIKVVPSDIYISSVGSGTDAYVEIENKSDFEMPISNWIIKGKEHTFVIPDGTVLLSKKKIKFSPRVTSFDNSDINQVYLQNSNGDTVTTYPKIKIQSTLYSQSTTTSHGKSSTSLRSAESDIIDLNNLAASAGEAEGGKGIPKSLVWAGLGGVIILGVASALLLRRKSKYGNEIEGEISASDMTIME